jgi:hypothetical protein
VLHADARITGDTTVGYRGAYLSDRIGWREVTAVGDRITLTRTTVPAGSISARLTACPPSIATSDVHTADLAVRPGGPAAAPAPFAAAASIGSQTRDMDRFSAWFTGLVGSPELTVGVGLFAFGVALVLGGAHAVAPGHGKTIMAAYLVGSGGRLRQALIVAGTVAATHTVGVLALGILLATSLTLAPNDMYDWLRLASGVLVALVGAHLLRTAITTRASHSHPPAEAVEPAPAAARGAHTHTHAHADHTHADHGHADRTHADHTHGHVEHGHAHHDHAHSPVPVQGGGSSRVTGPQMHSHGGGARTPTCCRPRTSRCASVPCSPWVLLAVSRRARRPWWSCSAPPPWAVAGTASCSSSPTGSVWPRH